MKLKTAKLSDSAPLKTKETPTNCEGREHDRAGLELGDNGTESYEKRLVEGSDPLSPPDPWVPSLTVLKARN